MKYINRSHIMLLIGGFALAGCAGPTKTRLDPMLLCLSETGAKGSYVESSNRIGANGLPVIVPANGGDARGAVLMNACVEQHHIRMGTMPKAKATKPVRMVRGKLSVPEGYNLSPEDKALWPSLSLEQQKRALLFLKSGSTVQSSLQKD